jgi:diguanylate cyclase (GGDEF)-like protein
MSRYGLIRAVLVTGIVVIAAAVWGVGRIQSSADDSSTHAIAAGQQMLIAMLDQETGLRGYINTRRQSFLEPYRQGRTHLETAIADARAHATDAADRRLINAQVAAARRWQALAEQGLSRLQGSGAASTADALRRKAVMDRFRAANASFMTDKEGDRRRELRMASTLSVAVILALGIAFLTLGWLLFERPARRDAARRRRLGELGDALQVARTEDEAFDVLRRHLEAWLDRSRAVVLMRNASHNRLEAVTSLEDTPILAEHLENASPEACMSIRLAKPHERDPAARGLMVCELCGELPGPSACVPSVVGGEVVGAVVVQMPAPLGAYDQDDLTTSVSAAGPAIANLRNLAIAERRAATDALTGLANQRAVQDTLNRMTAQSSRSKSPLTAIMFDLDRFKRVNDIHGHAKGDEVLATVAAVVAANVRQSDFVGRYGGEEFIALLPDTARDGGVRLAEKLREAIETLELVGLDGGMSASFGVAMMPGDGVTGDQLVRAADRALYAAKNAGRNRVEVVRSGDRGGEPAESR